MKLINNLVILSLVAASCASATVTEKASLRGRSLQDDLLGIWYGVLKNPEEYIMVNVKLVNQAFQQPFGGFFVMTHNADEVPLFAIGENASEPLAILAENGDPSLLVEAYNNSENTGHVGAVTDGAPYFGGETLEFEVPYHPDYPYLTIASMAINTNDCFVALNGVPLGTAVHQVPGYDAGSEENNELCESIPGPACDADTGNERSGNGEGFVHIHRGFFGVGPELSAAGYDWRNPMMRVEMTKTLEIYEEIENTEEVGKSP